MDITDYSNKVGVIKRALNDAQTMDLANQTTTANTRTKQGTSMLSSNSNKERS